MAREHAAVRLDMWSDDDWRARTINAQWLYEFMLTNATLSYAGVADWRPARIAGHASDQTPAKVSSAAAELEDHFFVVIDEETEEILIRSFLRHDGLLKKPNVTKAMVRNFQEVVSPTIRGVIVHELQRLADEFPAWSAWLSPEVQSILAKPSINPKERVPNGSGKGSGRGNETDASLPSPFSLLPSPNSTHPATSPNEVREDVLALCSQLQELIEANGSKRPAITSGWLTEARLLLDKDGREFASASRLIAWCQDDSFWKANILSMPTFRKKYDQLRLQANAELEAKKKTQRPSGATGIADLLSLGRSMDGGMEAIAQ